MPIYILLKTSIFTTMSLYHCTVTVGGLPGVLESRDKGHLLKISWTTRRKKD